MALTHSSSAIVRPQAEQNTIFGTFGIYRYFLAHLVIATHAAPRLWSYAGEYAVFAFYVLSGYVVCYILRNRYLVLPKGVAKYFLNRALRIYPGYWVVAGLFFVMLLFYPEQAKDINGVAGYMHGGPLSGQIAWWVLVLTLLGFTLPFLGVLINPQLIPPTYSLGAEIFYWLLMPFMLMKKWVRWCVAGLAIGYTLMGAAVSYLYETEHNINTIMNIRYYSTFAGALPFCIGMWIFQRRSVNKPVLPHWLGVASIVAFIGLLVFARVLFVDPRFYGAYCSLALNGIIVAYLAGIDQATLWPWLRKADNFLGNLSYPVFIVHFPAMVLVHVFTTLPLHSAAFFLPTFIVADIAAVALHYSIEVPFNRVRRAVKC